MNKIWDKDESDPSYMTDNCSNILFGRMGKNQMGSGFKILKKMALLEQML